MRLLLLLPFSLLAQDTATLEGVVVNSLTGTPVRRAQVAVMPIGVALPPSTAMSDTQGQFSVAGLKPGAYRVTATHFNYTRPTRSPVVTLDGGDRKAVTVTLVPPAGISGRVVDADGDPAAYSSVQVFGRVYQDGRLTLTPVGASVTDDRGEYRVGGLGPGKYFVYLRPRPMPPSRSPLLPRTAERPEPAETWPPLYYPGVREFAAATPVTVEPGVDTTAVDFKLQSAAVVRVGGTITGMPSGPAHALSISMLPAGAPDGLFDQRASNTSGGVFRFTGVTPGSYVIRAEGTVGGRSYASTLPLEVGERSIDDLQVVLQAAADIPGRIRVEGGPNPMKYVVLAPADQRRVMRGVPARGEVAPDGTFVLPDVVPGVYSLAINDMPLYVRSASFAGQAVTPSAIQIPPGSAGPLEIVASTKLAQVNGVAEGEPGTPVVLTPESRQYNRVALTALDGRFSFPGVRPGKYTIAALAGADLTAAAMAWTGNVLEAVEKHGTNITVEEDAQLTLQLRAIPAP